MLDSIGPGGMVELLAHAGQQLVPPDDLSASPLLSAAILIAAMALGAGLGVVYRRRAEESAQRPER